MIKFLDFFKKNRLLIILANALVFTCGCSNPEKDQPAVKDRYITLNGTKIHYTSCGEGPVYVFVHGGFGDSYMWRNVMPIVANKGKCIAIDLPGFGKSEKPLLDYTPQLQAKFLQTFIDSLELNDIVLIGQDWGASLCLDYFSRAEHKVRGLVLSEPILSHPTQKDLDDISSNLARKLLELRMDSSLDYKVLNQNYISTNILPLLTKSKWADTVLQHYTTPYQSATDRRAQLAFISAFPINGLPDASIHFIDLYRGAFFRSDAPKIIFLNNDNVYLSEPGIDFLKSKLKNTSFPYLDAGFLHAEDQPEKMANEILKTFANQ